MDVIKGVRCQRSRMRGVCPLEDCELKDELARVGTRPRPDDRIDEIVGYAAVVIGAIGFLAWAIPIPTVARAHGVIP